MFQRGKKSTIAGLLSCALVTSLTFYQFSYCFYQDFDVQVVPKPPLVCLENKDSTPALPPPGDLEKKTSFVINKGDTVRSVLSSIGMNAPQIHLAVEALREVYDPKALKIGQRLNVTYKEHAVKDGIPSIHLIALDFKVPAKNEILLRYKEGMFEAEKFDIQLKKVTRKMTGRVRSSFYAAALKKGIPVKIVKEAIAALSYDVNWQHDPQINDEFEILYEVFEDAEGNFIKAGDLKFASFAPGGNWRRIYAFETTSGEKGFFNDKGQSIKKSLLQTPLDPIRMRVTSKFGLRKHPILGYSKMHKGVDFGAPTGTPVMSSGNGMVIKAGWNGAYGNYILIRHQGGYCTGYGHLSKMHVKPGMKVEQRQVIGAVGTTGRSTGPHLHYEVIYNGQHVNPQLIKQLPSTQLSKQEMKKFEQIKSIFDKHEVTNSISEIAFKKIPFTG